jgi:hypothetical protein
LVGLRTVGAFEGGVNTERGVDSGAAHQVRSSVLVARLPQDVSVKIEVIASA